MPTPDARAAFAEALQLMPTLRSLHEQELMLMATLDAALTEADRHKLQAEVQMLRDQWTATFQQYSDAVTRYTAALKASREQ